MKIRVSISHFKYWICILLLSSACGKQATSTIAAAPTRAFVASDFENNAASDSNEIEVQVVARDPFQAPDGLRPEVNRGEERVVPVRWRPEVVRVHEESPTPISAVMAATATASPSDEQTTEEPQLIEVTWPDIRIFGMIRGGNGRWMAAIDGNVIREGEWITPNVRLARADQNGVDLIHRSGAIRRMNAIDGRENG